MKKVILALGLLTSLSASAHGYDGYGYRGHYYRGGGYDWVAPLAIGGIIGYQLSQPRTVIVQQPQVVYQQPPVMVQQPQVIQSQPLYRKDTIYDATCSCYREVLVQVQ